MPATSPYGNASHAFPASPGFVTNTSELCLEGGQGSDMLSFWDEMPLVLAEGRMGEVPVYIWSTGDGGTCRVWL